MLRTYGVTHTHIRLARLGEIIDSVTVTEAAMPDYSPATNWTKLSDSIGALTDMPERGSRVDVMKTVGGHRELRSRISLGPASRKITFTQEDQDELIRELLTMSGKIDTSAATDVGDYVEYNPFGGTLDGVKGWFHFQQYNQDNELVHMEVAWGELMLDGGVKFGDEVTKPSLELTLFPNALSVARDYRPTASSS
ncbi:MAG: hypothetical protein JWM59_1542 [Verrucomicrobiales bacterium]|nr:hypothetical protein [Verrucomicrobiales bacterium]